MAKTEDQECDNEFLDMKFEIMGKIVSILTPYWTAGKYIDLEFVVVQSEKHAKELATEILKRKRGVEAL